MTVKGRRAPASQVTTLPDLVPTGQTKQYIDGGNGKLKWVKPSRGVTIRGDFHEAHI